MTAYLRPGTLEEALAARRRWPEHLLLAGGTDLMVDARGRPEPPGIIDLFGLPELCGVTGLPDGGLRIGALTTYAQLLRDPAVSADLPALHAAAREVGAVQIQARGTLGGNVATSSPVGDTLPVLLALGAELELASSEGARRCAYEDFICGYRQTTLGPAELIVAFCFPPSCRLARQYWRKVGSRRAQTISKVMVAGAAWLEEDGRIASVRLALGAVADRPLRATSAEAVLGGERPGPALAQQAREALVADISPIDDLRSSAAYRLRVAQNLVARFVLELAVR